MARRASIRELRARIDRLDDQILRLLEARAELASRIGQSKAARNSDPYVPPREQRVLARLERAASGRLPPAAVRAIFREVISASRALEGPLRVAYLGPVATFAHQAAREHLGAGALYLPAATIPDVFREVETGRAELGVVPVENSTEGVVAHTLDSFLDSPLSVAGEVLLEVRHALLTLSGRLDGVRRIVSHPQALAQCRRWLATHARDIPLEEETSTARAAERAAGDPRLAAIASRLAAETFGLKVAGADVHDEAQNVTRFLVLARHDASRPSGHDKTSIFFTVADEVGVLHRMLRPFAAHRIDLIKIESRPLRGRPWEYVFYLDLRGHRRERRVAQALAEVARGALSLRVLGSYPAAH